jgi:hypothetical protein
LDRYYRGFIRGPLPPNHATDATRSAGESAKKRNTSVRRLNPLVCPRPITPQIAL